MIYGVLLKPIPYQRPGQIRLIWKSVPKKSLEGDWTSYPTYTDWKRDAASFNDLAAFLRPDGSIINLSENGNVEQIQSSKVSSNFFNVLGTPAMLGRTFQSADVGNGARLAVLSYEFWIQRFSSNPRVIGTTLRIDETPFQVIGVMPPDFAFPAKEPQSWSPARQCARHDLRQSLTPVVLGLFTGAMMAIACSHILAGFLYGIPASDPITYVSVCGLLLAIAAVASFVPAHRAIMVDPLVLLRFE